MIRAALLALLLVAGSLPALSQVLGPNGLIAPTSATAPVAGVSGVLVPSSGSPPVTTTWSATNLASNIVLSGGNLVASDTPQSNDTGRSDSTISGTQRYYWEVTMTTVHLGTGNIGVGLVNGSWVFTNNNYLGQTGNSSGYYADGSVLFNGGQPATLATYAQGAVIGTAVDFGAGLVWWTLNGTTWNSAAIGSQNPAVGSQVGGIAALPAGTVFPAYNVSGTGAAASSLTFNPGTTFAYTVPTGFTHLP